MEVFESEGINSSTAPTGCSLTSIGAGSVPPPASILDQTKMPVYFDEGKSPLTEVLGGDADKQIAAIWSDLNCDRRCRRRLPGPIPLRGGKAETPESGKRKRGTARAGHLSHGKVARISPLPSPLHTVFRVFSEDFASKFGVPVSAFPSSPWRATTRQAAFPLGVSAFRFRAFFRFSPFQFCIDKVLGFGQTTTPFR